MSYVSLHTPKTSLYPVEYSPPLISSLLPRCRLSMEELNPVIRNVNLDCDELNGIEHGREQSFIKKKTGGEPASNPYCL